MGSLLAVLLGVSLAFALLKGVRGCVVWFLKLALVCAIPVLALLWGACGVHGLIRSLRGVWP